MTKGLRYSKDLQNGKRFSYLCTATMCSCCAKYAELIYGACTKKFDYSYNDCICEAVITCYSCGILLLYCQAQSILIGGRI